MGIIQNSINCCCPSKSKHIALSINDIDDNISPIKINTKARTLKEIKIKSGNCIRKRSVHPEEVYEKIKDLGEGAFGSVIQARHKSTNEIRAIKMIEKKHLKETIQGSSTNDIENEINILKELDHPNIIKVYEFFEYDDYYYIVSEYIGDGDLFTLISNQTIISEDLALYILHQVISAVNYLHLENVFHGDIKPENIMLDNYKKCNIENFNYKLKKESVNSYNSGYFSRTTSKDFNNFDFNKDKNNNLIKDMIDFDIKLIDFGTSRIFNKPKIFDKLVGTCYYVAPEVILKGYHKQCDLWSCGVVLYVMLAGKYPFNGDSEEEIYESIKKGKFSLSEEEFKNIRKDTIDLLKLLLETDPLERITANKALNHKAFESIKKCIISKNTNYLKNNNSQIMMQSFQNKLTNFNKNSDKKFLQAVTTFIIHNFISREIALKYKELFKVIDTDGDGRLSKEELINGYKRMGNEVLNQIKKDNKNNKIHTYKSQLSTRSLDDIVTNIDKDNNGYIEVEEFIAAAIDINELLTEDNIKLSFESIDIDKSGKISLDELGKFIGGEEYDLNLIKEVIVEAGKDPEKDINYNDFKDIMETLKI